MKRLIVSILTASALSSASAQLFSPESLNGALLGTFIGGIAGGNHHHGFSGNGAAIGAGVGLLAGAVVGEARRQDYYASQPYYYYPAPVYAQPGYGYATGPAYVSTPVYVAAPPRPNYAVGGTLTGALAGGLIGAGYHRGWEGAGIGAAAGLVAGTVAEVATQKQERKWATAQAVPISPQPVYQAYPAGHAPAPQVAPTPQVYRLAANPGWGHQIADAPVVPDAPRF
jgi:outer membrane lipoprotein SlyB